VAQEPHPVPYWVWAQLLLRILVCLPELLGFLIFSLFNFIFMSFGYINQLLFYVVVFCFFVLFFLLSKEGVTKGKHISAKFGSGVFCDRY